MITDQSTSTAQTDNNDNLTLDKLMDAMRLIQKDYPIIFLMVSEHVPTDDGQVFLIDNNGATPFGKDIICHPLQVQGVIDGLSSKYIIRLMDAAERARRHRKILTKDGADGGFQIHGRG